VAVAEKTEQRVGHKNEPGDRGEQDQCEKVLRVTVNHQAHIAQRSGNQSAAQEATRACKTAVSSAHIFYCHRPAASSAIEST
jgi:hypothetical protein